MKIVSQKVILESTQSSFESISTKFKSNSKSFSNFLSEKETEEKKRAEEINIKEDMHKELQTQKLLFELNMILLGKIHKQKLSLPTKKIDMQLETTYVKTQTLNFQTKAYIQTENKKIEIDMNINLKSSFIKHTKMQNVSFDIVDPLVLNLNSEMPNLSKTTFNFDIDSDGEEDQISNLSKDCAFLALDKNNNNLIDNGLELFGTKSGNGFKDLLEYDSDSNNWIDENDEIFSKLRIWQKTDNEDRLLGLGQAGIGAIFLGNTNTDFSLKTSNNELLGQMRRTSFFLYENGKSSVISQIDLNKQKNSSIVEV